MPTHRADLAIVGGGILGLAHAYIAARAGKNVVLFERNQKALGASVRNFGMIWPIGQPAGIMHAMALRSRELWLEVLAGAKLPYLPTGSLHVVHRADEAAVAQEFAEVGPALGYECRWLTRDQVLAASHAVVPENLMGGLASDVELTVDPRLTIAALPAFLAERYAVQLRYGCAVHSIDLPHMEAGSEHWEVDHAIVCSGDDFEMLYPEEFAASGIVRCKLQMLRTVPQPDGWQLGPALAAGLTLRFYAAFQVCRTLDTLRHRISTETPEFDRYGIHGLVSQTAHGELTLGDSHEYGNQVDIFNKEEIDSLLLGYLRQFLRAPSWQIAQRWHGVYAKHPEKPLVRFSPARDVTIVTAPGGSGMTLSFGIAEQTFQEIA